MRTEDLRDTTGKFLGTRVFEVDALGRETFVDVTTDLAVAVGFDTVLAAIQTQVSAAAKAGVPPSSPAAIALSAVAPILNRAQLSQIARSKGSKKKDDK